MHKKTWVSTFVTQLAVVCSACAAHSGHDTAGLGGAGGKPAASHDASVLDGAAPDAAHGGGRDAGGGIATGSGDASTSKGTAGKCDGTSVCTADYPCQALAPGYTCRGQFADWTPTDSPSSFTDNGDGTVTDTRNKLVWQQTVDDSGSGATWAGAKASCAGLSFTGAGWRLPTLAELQSILDFGRFNPAIDSTAFPNTPTEAYWTSSPTTAYAANAWLVSFYDGMAYYNGTDAPGFVRCVRSSAAVVASNGSGGAPPGRYTFPANGTVYDTRTKLTWQQTADDLHYVSQPDALAACAGLTLDGGGWRAPKVSELLTIVDPTEGGPAIDGKAFLNAAQTWHWSSSPDVHSADTGWRVDFSTGLTQTTPSGSSNLVRCVR